VQPIVVHHVALGEGHQALANPQQLADLQMLAGLRHDPLVGGNHQHDQIHPADAGDHGPDKAFMAGHIDDPELDVPRQFKMREAELDGDAPLLLLLQAIRVDTGQSPDQGGLTVIDMAGGAEYEMLHGRSFSSLNTMAGNPRGKPPWFGKDGCNGIELQGT
jgi:hypothetical protein